MRDWSIVMPVKRLTLAKSRLRGAVPAPVHHRLALALVADTISAACRAYRVLVVTDDPEVRDLLAGYDAHAVTDRPDAGLNAAVRHGAAVAAERWPAAGIAALAADLPALRTAELLDALDAAGAAPRCYVADTTGAGTTLLTAAPGVPVAPRFGPGSAVAHAASGAVALTGDWPGLRRDVDTPADLAAASAFGLGSHSAALLDSPACRG